MHLDDEAVRAARGGGQRHGRNEAVDAGGVARVDNDRQVRQLVQHGHGREVERVAGVVAEGADAALAEDDLLVAAGHDVFRAHQQLLERVGQAALEEDGLVRFAELAQQIEILHVACADLQNVHVVEQRKIRDAHDLGDDGQARLFPGDFQQLKALGFETREIIGGGAGLECAAAQHVRTGCLDGFGHGDDLFFRFNGARACDHAEMAAADLHIADLHDGIVWMVFAIAAFERLGHALDAVHNVEAGDQIHVHAAGVADEAEDGLVVALGDVDVQAEIFQPADQLVAAFLGNAVLQYNDHD